MPDFLVLLKGGSFLMTSMVPLRSIPMHGKLILEMLAHWYSREGSSIRGKTAVGMFAVEICITEYISKGLLRVVSVRLLLCRLVQMAHLLQQLAPQIFQLQLLLISAGQIALSQLTYELWLHPKVHGSLKCILMRV